MVKFVTIVSMVKFVTILSMVKYVTIVCERLNMVKYITIVCMVKSVTIVSTLYLPRQTIVIYLTIHITQPFTNYCYRFNHMQIH